jgi:2-polyprenyl-3-methyl-5-hydroxy-6-metoxy-1,4-benzoquinol methylase
MSSNKVADKFVRAIVRALRDRWLPGTDSPLLDITELGRGGYGFALRGYIHLRGSEVRERAKWLVVKGPMPRWVGPDGAQKHYLVENQSLEGELWTRSKIGAIPGLGSVPRRVSLPCRLVLEYLPSAIAEQLHLPEEIVLLVVALPVERIVHAPPEPLGNFVVDPVSTAVDLSNWCEIARGVGAALLGMHGQRWVHRDIKLNNVVAQMESGFLRSIEVIDFGTAASFSAATPKRGAESIVGTTTYFRPGRLTAESWQPASAMDEDVYAYASLLARVLLGRPPSGAHPDARTAAEVEELVVRAVERGPQADEPLAEEICEAFALLRELLLRPHADGIASITSFLHRVDRLRIAALQALGRGRYRGSHGLRLLPELLGSLEVCAAADDETRWCARYGCTNEAEARAAINLPAGVPIELPHAIAILRLGYVALARRALDRVCAGLSGDDAADAHALRLYVGVPLMRGGEIGEAREVLARYAGATSPSLVWWIDMLRARLDLLEGRHVDVARFHGEPLGPREQSWVHALEALVALRSPAAIDPEQSERLRFFIRGSVSTPELLFAIMLFAKNHARTGDLVKALRWLHAGIGEAAAREFPVEYATFLVLAARMVVPPGGEDELRRSFAEQRVDVDALYETAEKLAIHAADIFDKLGAGAQRDRAVRVAASCAAARSTFTGIASAAGWYELAAANEALSRRASRHHRLEDIAELRRFWQRTPRDPGTSEAQLYYNRYGWVIEKLWGTGGLSIERVQGGAPAAGLVLDELLAAPPLAFPPSNILVVGCGTGGDVFHLAKRYPGARVHGIDISSWSIDAAKKHAKARGEDGRCTFRCVDVLSGDPIVEGGGDDVGPWDLVVMRETLAHVTFKRSFLGALRRTLRAGTELRITDLVQRRPVGPTAWRSALRAIAATNLASQEGLREDLEHARFELTSEPFDASPDMAELFANRLAWAQKSADPAAVALRSPPLVARRLRQMLGALVEASRTGALGWVHVTARATDDDPPPPSQPLSIRGYSSTLPPDGPTGSHHS